MTESNAPLRAARQGEPVASVDTVTTLIQSFGQMMADMERRITERINENAAASRERWTRWEADFCEYRNETNRRIELLEVRVETHLDTVDREHLVWDARFGPVRNAARFVARNWRTILLLLFALLGVLGMAQGTLGWLVGL